MTAPKFAKSTRHGRVYVIDGDEYPSVTNVIGQLNAPALTNWKLKKVAEAAVDTQDWRTMPRDAASAMIVAAGTGFAERAADAGTHVHSLIEHGTPPEDAPQAMVPYLVAAALVVARMGKHYASELTLFNPEVGYAGTADVLSHRLDYGQELAVTDWKTVQAGKSVGWSNQQMQGAALSRCTHYLDSDGDSHELEYPITEIAVVGLRPDGTSNEKRTSNELLIWKAQRSFLGLLESWKYEKDFNMGSSWG